MDEAVFEDTGLSALEQRQQLLSHHVTNGRPKTQPRPLRVRAHRGARAKAARFKRRWKKKAWSRYLSTAHHAAGPVRQLFQYRDDQVGVPR